MSPIDSDSLYAKGTHYHSSYDGLYMDSDLSPYAWVKPKGKFEIGDEIEFSLKGMSIDGIAPHGLIVEKNRYEVLCVGDNGTSAYILERNSRDLTDKGALCPCGKHSWVVHLSEVNNGLYKLIKKQNTKSMAKEFSMVEKFKLLTKPEPEKTFVKAGITEMDGSLTLLGREMFSVFLFEKFKLEFKTEVVDKLLAEQKSS